MDSLLEFFSNLILFTAGLAVVVFWVVIIIVVVIEIHDGIKDITSKSTEEEDL